MQKNQMSTRLHTAGYQRELERVRRLVDRIKHDAADRFILNFYAPHGFGKTTLLALLWAEYERVLPTSLVCVRRFRSEDGTFDLCSLMAEIITDLVYRLPRRIAKVPANYEELTDKEELAEIINHLSSETQRADGVLLVLLDDYDAIPGDSSRWFESRVLGPVTRTRRAAFVLTSRLELKFTERIDLRMRRVSYELPRFEADGLSRTYPELEEIVPEILRFSGGLPLLTDQFIQDLEKRDITTAEDFRAHELGLLSEYYSDHVEGMLADRFTEESRETILVLSLLRRFDVKVMGRILPRVLAKYYRGYGTAEYIELIDRLGGWLYWRLDGGYAVNEASRKALEGYVRFEKPALYRKVHLEAESLYQDLLRGECRVDCVVELLYHRLALLQLEDRLDAATIQNMLAEELLEYLPEAVSAAELDSLRSALQYDPELKDYISEGIVITINDLIRERIKESRVVEFRSKSA